MNRIIAIAAAILLLARVGAGVLAQGCTDIAGSTYTNEQAEDALNHAAWGCGEEMTDSPILMAQCSLPIGGLKTGATIVVCFLNIHNYSDSSDVSVSANDFFLTRPLTEYEAANVMGVTGSFRLVSGFATRS